MNQPDQIQKLQLVVPVGHRERVTSVAISPSGRYALSAGSYDQLLILWEVSTGKFLRTFEGHTESINSIVFPPDGYYALAGANRSIKLWEVGTGKLLRTLKGHTDNVNSVAFSPDGRYALSGTLNGELILWEVNSWTLLRRLEGRTEGGLSVAFSPDSHYALATAGNGLILWEASTGTVVQRFEGHTSWIAAIAFSPDGRFVLSGTGDRIIKIWNVGTGTEIATLTTLDADEWVVTTPDGLFDASPGAMDLLYYVANDPTNLNEPWKVNESEQFQQSNYWPGLLTLLLSNT